MHVTVSPYQIWERYCITLRLSKKIKIKQFWDIIKFCKISLFHYAFFFCNGRSAISLEIIGGSNHFKMQKKPTFFITVVLVFLVFLKAGQTREVERGMATNWLVKESEACTKRVRERRMSTSTVPRAYVGKVTFHFNHLRWHTQEHRRAPPFKRRVLPCGSRSDG